VSRDRDQINFWCSDQFRILVSDLSWELVEMRFVRKNTYVFARIRAELPHIAGHACGAYRASERGRLLNAPMRVVRELVPHSSWRGARRVLRWLSLACALSACCACHVYRPELLLESPNKFADAGQSDIDGEAQSAASETQSGPQSGAEAAAPAACGRGRCWWSLKRDGCDSVGSPALDSRPAASRTANGMSEDQTFYLGLEAVQIATSATALPVGLDIDGVCTSSTSCTKKSQAVSCKPPTGQLAIDGDGCRDNALAGVMAMVSRMPKLADTLGLDDDEFNCELWRGGYNLLFRLSEYNGQSEDDSVRVDWYTSNGIDPAPSWRCPASDVAAAHPHWSNSARWNVDAQELPGPIDEPGILPESRVSDPSAYVRGGYLVSRMPDGAVLRFAGDAKPFRGFAMPVHEALWLGRVTKAADGEWTMSDGLIAGRVRTEDLLRSFQQAGLCKTTSAGSFFDTIASRVAQSADVLASGALAPNQTCDALSFGIAFTATQVTPGGADRPLEPLVECCECCDPGTAADGCMPRCGDGAVSGDEQCDTAIPADMPGACPTQCSASSSCQTSTLEGADCAAHCVESPLRPSMSSDGCCPDGANARVDSDCNPQCGNGVIEPGETCDPPGSCPSCATDDKCLRVKMSGSAATCDVVCSVSAVSECRSEDGCCPDTCTSGADNDCSTRCGNGRIDPGTTETCEYNIAPGCAQTCDDGDACTTDVKTGSSANCNVHCSHFQISALLPNDGCCPSGADAASDPDCVR
jgi:hypothetical protein